MWTSRRWLRRSTRRPQLDRERDGRPPFPTELMVRVLVIPTNEEIVIARAAQAVLATIED